MAICVLATVTTLIGTICNAPLVCRPTDDGQRQLCMPSPTQCVLPVQWNCTKQDGSGTYTYVQTQPDGR